MAPFVFPFFGIILFLTLFSFLERNRVSGRKRSSIALADVPAESMAHFLFERNSTPVGADERIEWALKAAVKKLNVDFAVLQLRDGASVSLWKYYSAQEAPEINSIFQVPFDETYCSSLTDTKSMLCIDYAGVSSWQNHPGRKKHGWEVYLGTRGPLNDGQMCFLGFYQNKSRGSLFTKGERDFVHHLLLWVVAILNRENSISSGTTKPDSQEIEKKEEIFET